MRGNTALFKPKRKSKASATTGMSKPGNCAMCTHRVTNARSARQHGRIHHPEPHKYFIPIEG